MQQIAQSNVSKAQSGVGKVKHAEGYPGMQRVFKIACRRGAVSRIERHCDTDDDPSNDDNCAEVVDDRQGQQEDLQ